MSNKEIKSKIEEIKKSFNDKKYDEVIKKIEDLSTIENRYAELSSLCGVCKIVKPNPNKNEILSALLDFEDAYKKAKKNSIGLDSVCNYISTCILYSDDYPELLKFLSLASIMYSDVEKFFGFNEKLSLIGIKLYKMLLDYDKMRTITHDLIKNNTKHLTTLCRWAYINNYSYKWKQENYLNYLKSISKIFPTYNTKSINNINFKSNKRVKIGFVGCNFNSDHSITYFMQDLVENLNKEKFETYAFDLGRYSKNNLPLLELKKKFDHYLEYKSISNQEVIELIQGNQIEILIDIMSITHPERIGIFNNRVSPIQISWLAYCNTSGFDKIDFLIADRNVIKDEEEKYYSEKIIKLPNIWSSHSGFKLRRKFNDLPLLKNNFVTFGSFNNFLKISDDVVDTWSKILRKIIGSKLILKSSDSYDYEIIKKKFAKYGVDNAIEILEKRNYDKIEDHLNVYNKIDIALDTFPYTGVTTTFEALWMNVPVIAMNGHNFKSRCGASILKNANVDQLICLNKSDYIEKVIGLTKDIKILQKIRKELFENVLNTPLFDTKKYAIEFNKVLLEIYKK